MCVATIHGVGIVVVAQGGVRLLVIKVLYDDGWTPDWGGGGRNK